MESTGFMFNQKLAAWVGLGLNQTYRQRLIRYYVIGFMASYCVLSQILFYEFQKSSYTNFREFTTEPGIKKTLLSIQLCQLFTSDGDLFSVLPILNIFMITICVAVLYYTAVVHYMTFWTLCSYITQDREGLKNEVELQIMQKHIYITKLFTLITTLIFYIGVATYISPSVLRIILSPNEVRRDIDRYPIISCFDYFLDRRTHYHPIVIFQIIITAVMTTVAIAIYSSYFLIIQHVCARLSIIKYEMTRPFISKDHNDDLLETPIDLSQWVIDIVQRLARTTKFLTLLSTATEKVYLVQMVLAFLFLILDFLCLFQIPTLLKNEENREDVLPFIFFVFVTVTMIYVNCYIGQRLIDYSMAVYKEACLVPIHNLSLKTQKLLLTTLMISSKPLTLSIGKVYVSSHEFFSNIIQSALSFAMILRSVQRI